MADVSVTNVDEVSEVNTDEKVQFIPTVKETNMNTSTTPNVVRIDSLSAADKKTLQRIFGALPDAGSVTLSGRKAASKTQSGCECGCGVDCPSRFIAGHDARLHSVLLSVSKGETPKTPNHGGFSVKTAKAELARRGW